MTICSSKMSNKQMTSENLFVLKLLYELHLSRVFAYLQPSAMSSKKRLPSAMYRNKSHLLKTRVKVARTYLLMRRMYILFAILFMILKSWVSFKKLFKVKKGLFHAF